MAFYYCFTVISLPCGGGGGGGGGGGLTASNLNLHCLEFVFMSHV